jgi:hypothetical protein
VVGAVVVEQEGALTVAVVQPPGLLGGDAGVDQVVEQQGAEGRHVGGPDVLKEARQGRP